MQIFFMDKIIRTKDNNNTRKFCICTGEYECLNE